MKKFIIYSLALFYVSIASGQVGINFTSADPDPSAGLDVDFSNLGVLIPRVALTQTTSSSPITSPATSLLVYNTASVNDVTPGFYYWNGSSWVRFATGTITVANLTFDNSGSGASSGVTYNGTTAQTISYNTIGAVGGSGTATRVAFWNGSNTLSSNANLYWDNNNYRLGIGTATPEGKLSVAGDVGIGAIANTDQANHMLDIASTKGGTNNSAIRAFYPAGGILAGTEFAAIAHRDNEWKAVYAKAGTGSAIALYTDGEVNMMNGNVGIGTTSPGATLDVSGNGRFGLSTNGNTSIGNDGNAYIEMRESDNSGTPYIDFSNDNTSDYDARIILEDNNHLSFSTSTNGRQLSIHSTGIALSGSNKYLNFGNTFDASGYGFRDNGGTIEYKHSGGTWTPFAQPPTIPGNTEWWIRPTGELYIRPMYNANAKVYDAGQTWAFYYDGYNTNGSFFAGGSVGAIMHRAGISSTNVPTFASDQYPFVDANNDAAITPADNVTYSGGYAYGSLFNGFTGISKWDAGLRGIGLGNSDGTNGAWPVVGVLGEVVATGSYDYGQQAIYGWQAAPAGSGSYCLGVLGRTSQTGNQSAGVAGYYTNTVGTLETSFTSFKTIGLLGAASFGVLGQSDSAGTSGVLGINTDLTSSLNIGVKGYVGDGTSQTRDFKAVVGISDNTNDYYGYGGYFEGEFRGIHAVNPTTSGGYAVYYSGNLGGTGTKSCIMKTSQGPKALYCVESPENYFEDYGTAKLVNGRARIDIDPIFLETITISDEYPYKVFIQMIDEIPNSVHIVKHDTYFEVIENNQGTSTATFDWRLVAKRKGYEELRLKDAPEAYTDPALYPDPNDPSIPAEWRKKVHDHFEFLKKVKNVPIQKHEVKPTKNIDKSALEKKN